MSAAAGRIAGHEAGLVGFQYADRFSVPAAVEAPAGEWAYRSLRSAERHRGAFSKLIWQGALGFRLDPGAPGTLLGWRIEEDSPGRLVMAADGRLMEGRLMFEVGSEVVWTTALRFHGSAGRFVWWVLGAVHRPAVPRSLHAASASLLRRPVTA